MKPFSYDKLKEKLFVILLRILPYQLVYYVYSLKSIPETIAQKCFQIYYPAKNISKVKIWDNYPEAPSLPTISTHLKSISETIAQKCFQVYSPTKNVSKVKIWDNLPKTPAVIPQLQYRNNFGDGSLKWPACNMYSENHRTNWNHFPMTNLKKNYLSFY